MNMPGVMLLSVLILTILIRIAINIAYYHDKEKHFFIITSILSIISLFYFLISDTGFSANFIKYPEKIVPSLFILISIISILIYIIMVKYELNTEAPVAGIAMWFVLITIWPYANGSIISHVINYSTINKEKIPLPENFSKYKIVKIKEEQDKFLVGLLIKDKSICNYYTEDISYYTEKNILKDKQKNTYSIKDIMVNGKKYDGMNNLCLDIENTISYKINKNIK